MEFVKTPKAFRVRVTEWLQEEKATPLQALQLLDAVYGGVIAGMMYHGHREEVQGLVDDLHEPLDDGVIPELEYDYYRHIDGKNGCGCLLETLEQIQGRRKSLVRFRRPMPEVTEQVFSLAVYIPFGGTPSNNSWAKAAAQGIEDYLNGVREEEYA